jgi:hypothetical protein
VRKIGFTNWPWERHGFSYTAKGWQKHELDPPGFAALSVTSIF